MEEKKLQRKLIITLLTIGAFALLYAYGGMSSKWLRRYIAPFIYFTTSIFLHKEEKKPLYRYGIQFPLAILSLSLGYGGDVLITKLLRRGLFALANTLAFLPWCKRRASRWTSISILHIVFVIASFVLLGVWNPLPARAEETLLGITIVLIPSMILYMKNNKEVTDGSR